MLMNRELWWQEWCKGWVYLHNGKNTKVGCPPASERAGIGQYLSPFGYAACVKTACLALWQLWPCMTVTWQPG